MSASEPIPTPENEPFTPPDPGERPDWLVGADEGVSAEHERVDRAAPEVKLHRPAPVPVEGFERAGDALRSECAAPGLPLSTKPASMPAPDTAARPQAWTAKSSSVPRLAVVPAAAKTVASAAPLAELDDEPERVIGSIADPGEALIGAEEADEARAPIRPLDEPWWMVLLERVATDRLLQLSIVSAIAVVIAAFVFWPHEGKGVSVSRIKQHPEAFEGQTVRVHGRVEEVFPLGQGWVYDLRQGHETITVFTRGAMPQRHARVEVVGQVSTGYLDGKPRVAILEGDQP